ncbi:MAG TPA: CARDB domain-containing protein, partial [Phycisphaerae bacterium]|nr:CARDB domain-containing protein [Phycisphaerae bacterium]
YMVSYADIWYDMDMVFSDFPEGAGWHMLADPDCEVTGNPEPDNGFSFYLVSLHELGHALGLGHDPIGDEPAGSAWTIGTMNPAHPAGGPVGNQNIVELHTDERRGMRFLYPGAANPQMDLANSGYSSKGPRLGKAVPSFFTPQTITPGADLTLWATYENFGTLPASNVRHAFYLSTDPTIDTTDMLLGYLDFNIVTNARTEYAAATDIPDLPAGTYYVGSILDSLEQVAEVYEDNNQADYCDPLVIAQAVPTFNGFNQYVITCDQPFTGPTPQVPYPVNMAPITWSLDNPQPGMTVDPATGVIHWPAPVKSPFIYEIVLRAANGAGSSTQTLRLGVQQAAPRITAIANHATKCGAAYTGPTPTLAAPACMSPVLGWSLVNGPPGMTINPSSGVVSWPEVIPGQGPYIVTIRAINDVGEATESWLLYVGSADGDLDANGLVNLDDVELFTPCIGGPRTSPTTGCVCADFDQDNDVDLRDYARLALVYSGETIHEGACCFSDGNCDVATPEYCYTLGGYFQGDGTSCSQASCSGACCFYTGGCLDFTLDFCDVAGGTYQGMGSQCMDLSCPASGNGACCWPNETCSSTSESACTTGGGHYQGTGLSCEAVDCTAPTGACCQVDGACSVGTEGDCAGTGGTFMGQNTTCTANQCDGACCYPDGACLDLSINACTVSAGEFEGPLTACGTYTCPVQAVGACCHTDDTCTLETELRCDGFGGSYQGDSTDCATAACAVRGACCLPTEVCAELTPVACSLQNGTYLGDGTPCTGIDCSMTEVGACYDIFDWTCQETGAGICTALGGTFEGADTTCAGTQAPEYANTIANPTTFYTPGANHAMADDMTLSGTGRGMTYYDLSVAGSGAPFNVTASLYTDCPGFGGTPIAGTQQTWTGVPTDGFIYTLSADFASPIRVPDSVWMVVTFSTADAGWVVAGPAEVGSTDDLYAENDPPWTCDYWFGGPPNDYAGFAANIQCVDIPEAQGACCHTDETCTFGAISECTAASGLFMGEDVACGAVDCANITVGACCDPTTWSCTLATAEDCAAGGGSFDGVGTSCSGACP